jgi:three-Cys-motif partner protein
MSRNIDLTPAPPPFAWLHVAGSILLQLSSMATQYVTGDDGLAVEKVGTWAKRKHKILTDYAFAAGGPRTRFCKNCAAYIDVFCGPGRSLIRTTGEYIDGSAIAAFKSGLQSPCLFTSIEISDAAPKLLAAAEQRLTKLQAPVRTASGPARQAIVKIVDRLNPNGLHFAFLDPHNLGSLSFSLFRQLARLKYVDVLVHVSVADLRRNAGLYTDEDYDQFDEFAPDWRSKIGTNMNNHALRGALLKYWTSEIEAVRPAARRTLRAGDRTSGSTYIWSGPSQPDGLPFAWRNNWYSPR